jgi:uncharacterized protein YukE
MAKSAVVIRIEFEKVKAQADRLDEIARDLKQTADNQLGNVLSGVENAWKSDSATGYLKKGKQVQEQLTKRANEVEKAATAMRTIAKNIYDAEMRAYQLAKVRKY